MLFALECPRTICVLSVELVVGQVLYFTGIGEQPDNEIELTWDWTKAHRFPSHSFEVEKMRFLIMRTWPDYVRCDTVVLT